MNTTTIILLILAAIPVLIWIVVKLHDKAEARSIKKEEDEKMPQLALTPFAQVEEYIRLSGRAMISNDIRCILKHVERVENYSYHNRTEIDNKHIQITVRVETFKESVEEV